MIMMDFSDDNTESMDFMEDIKVDKKIVPQNETIELEVGSSIDQSMSPQPQLPSYRVSGNIKVALLVPKKIIGSYADSVTNAILSYLIRKDAEFILEVFDSEDESEEKILRELSSIRVKGFDLIIAPYTKKGTEIIVQNSSDLLVFVPTINRFDIDAGLSSVVFGGIDYKRQIDHLLGRVNDKVVVFGDGSEVSSSISEYIKERSLDNFVYGRDIKNIRSNMSSFLKNNKKIKKSSIFLNMSLTKSSLLASQLTQNDVEPFAILSTQFNYNPLLFKLTQFRDREFLFIANSIDFQDERLKDINKVLGNSPDFNWIDYSTSIGLDYFYTSISGDQRLFDEEIFDNQIEYKVRVERAGRSSFMPIGTGKYEY
jgi:SRSO17 transposase